ncbi:hypothetical protein CI610_01473 [invertebrate metagenome]|uniref:Uncharacterized protein n=1 Tax=invertebrate metagenome TaxID=1711999 RepID=A0A2H9T8V3_9ZZZZ
MNKPLADPPESPGRRHFIRRSILGGLFLVGGSGSILSSGCSHSQPGSRYIWLTNQESVVLKAIIPVILRLVFVDITSRDQLVYKLDQSVSQLPMHSQKELRDLFALLNSPLKGFLTGIWGSWQTTPVYKVERFLERWRTSPLSLCQKAYNGLAGIIIMKGYENPGSWEDIQYPGVPQADLLVTRPNDF